MPVAAKWCVSIAHHESIAWRTGVTDSTIRPKLPQRPSCRQGASTPDTFYLSFIHS